MSFNHTLSDLVVRIKNGSISKKIVITSPFSLMRERVLRILKDEGYISDYVRVDKVGVPSINVYLKYNNFVPVISEIRVISKPGRRVYNGSTEFPLVKNGLGVLLVSTSQGILSDYEARSRNLGGELLFQVF